MEITKCMVCAILPYMCVVSGLTFVHLSFLYSKLMNHRLR